MPLQKITEPEILSGWKDIANYMGRGVRTVQRYERELGLPIRRPAGKVSGSVIATKVEIDAWITAAPLRKKFTVSFPAPDNTELIKEFRQQVAELHRLRVEAAQSRADMSAPRKALRESIRLLRQTLRLSKEINSHLQGRGRAEVLIFDSKRRVG